MAKIINFPPQPGKFEEFENTWFFEGTTCKENRGQPDGKERNCPSFVKKYPNDKVTADRCHCHMCQYLELCKE